MAIDLKNLTPSQLQSLIESAHSQMSQAKASQIQETRAKIDDLLAKAGLTLDEVYHRRGTNKAKAGKTSSHLKGTTVVPKYRNPEDHSQTWSGRGRQPIWVAEALKKRGVTLDSLLIVGGKTTAKKATKKVTRKVAKKAVKKTVRRKAKG